MKNFEILGGKAYAVLLPDGAPIPDVINTGLPHLSWLDIDIDLPDINLPPGNWRIVGMLPEVTESEAAELVDAEETEGVWPFADVFCMDYEYGSYTLSTALESLESAILAEGYTFKNKYGDVRPRIDDYSSVFQYRNDAIDYDYEEERVLCRERCLLLRRVDG